MRASALIPSAIFISGPLLAGPPMITDDPDTLDPGCWEINLATTLERRADTWNLEAPLLDCNYGLMERVQLKFEIPYLVELNEGAADQSGVGDSSLGMKWRFLDQETAGLSVSTYPQIAFQSSQHAVDRGLADEGFELLLPLQFSRELDDKTTVFGDLGFNYAEHGEDGWIWGIAGGREIREGFSLLAELHGQCGKDWNDQEIVCNAGFHWSAFDHVALIGSLGTGLIEGTEPLPKLIAYLGTQLTF